MKTNDIRTLDRGANLIRSGSRVVVPRISAMGSPQLRSAVVLEVAQRPSLRQGHSDTLVRVAVDGEREPVWLDPSDTVRV